MNHDETIEIEDVSPTDFETLLEFGFGEPDPAKRDAALQRWKDKLQESVQP